MFEFVVATTLRCKAIGLTRYIMRSIDLDSRQLAGGGAFSHLNDSNEPQRRNKYFLNKIHLRSPSRFFFHRHIKVHLHRMKKKQPRLHRIAIILQATQQLSIDELTSIIYQVKP